MTTYLRNFVKLCLLFGVIGSLCSCTPKTFWADRGNDALDVFSFGAGMGVGAKIQAGPLQTGALFEADGITVRGGELSSGGLLHNGEWQLLAIGDQQFITAKGGRNKNYSSNTTVDGQTTPFFYRLECPDKAAKWYYSQLEAVVGAGPALRLGFNPGELLDFFLGWFEVDIMDDDLFIDAPRKAQELAMLSCPKGSVKRKLALE